MVNLAAGTLIRALDYPVSVDDYDGTAEFNFSDTTYKTGSPVVSTTFEAATTQRALLTVAAAIRGPGRVFVAPRVRQDNSSGLVILSPTVRNGITNSNTSGQFEVHSRTVLLTGLEAGRTYYAELMYRGDGGGTTDITSRQIQVDPTP